MSLIKSTLLGSVLLVLGGGAGVWVSSVLHRPQAVADAATRDESAAIKAQLGALQAELDAARGTIESLEAKLAAAPSAAAPGGEEVEVPAGPTDLNTVFQQAKPLLKTLGPFLDNARRRGTKAMAERRVAEMTEKYGLTTDQQEAVKKWFEDKSEADAARGRELLDKPDAGLQDLIAAGRGQRPDDGLDEMMAGTLSPEQLAAYRADRLQERAASVEKEANRRVSQLNEVVQLDEAQQDKVFAIMARSSDNYDPAMQLEGLGTDEAALAEGASRDEAILAVLRPDQRQAYEADRQRRRDEAAKNLEAMGLKPPADLGVLEGLGR
jgi:hypothetical protein